MNNICIYIYVFTIAYSLLAIPYMIFPFAGLALCCGSVTSENPFADGLKKALIARAQEDIHIEGNVIDI